MFKNVSTSSPVKVISKAVPLQSLSKSKPKSARSKFYSALMTNLGGKVGDDLGEAFTANEHEKFRAMMVDLADKMAKVESK